MSAADDNVEVDTVRVRTIGGNGMDEYGGGKVRVYVEDEVARFAGTLSFEADTTENVNKAIERFTKTLNERYNE